MKNQILTLIAAAILALPTTTGVLAWQTHRICPDNYVFDLFGGYCSFSFSFQQICEDGGGKLYREPRPVLECLENFDLTDEEIADEEVECTLIICRNEDGVQIVPTLTI